MSGKKNPSDGDRSWNWAYLIPIMALMIPIVAITGLNLTEVLTKLGRSRSA